jgi:glycosyltransferase involved in cell wall biosynthesis
MNVYLTGATTLGFWYGYIENLVSHGPDGVEYFFDPKFLDQQQFKRILPPTNTLKSSRFPVSTVILKFFPILKWLHDTRGYDFPYVQFLKIKNKINIDLTHSNIRLLIHDKPWVVTLDSPAMLTCFRIIDAKGFTYCRYPKLTEFVLRKLVLSKNCRKLLPFSKKAKEELLMYFRVPEEKIEIIPPSIRVPQRPTKKRSDDKITILFVGRQFYRKGGRVVLDLFEKLSERYDNIYLVLKTRTPRSAMIPEDLDRIEKNERVSWISTHTHEIESLYLNANIFVLPTMTDFLPLVILEAMSFALPVIATNVYAIPEMIEDGKTGYIVSKGDVEVFEERLTSLIESRSLREKMGMAGRERVKKNFSNEIVNEKLKMVYDECLKK